MVFNIPQFWCSAGASRADWNRLTRLAVVFRLHAHIAGSNNRQFVDCRLIMIATRARTIHKSFRELRMCCHILSREMEICLLPYYAFWRTGYCKSTIRRVAIFWHSLFSINRVFSLHDRILSVTQNGDCRSCGRQRKCTRFDFSARLDGISRNCDCPGSD
jgi:hypothetical protein